MRESNLTQSIPLRTFSRPEWDFEDVNLWNLMLHTDVVGRDEASVTANSFLAMGNDQWLGSRVDINSGDNYGNGKDSSLVLVATLSPVECDFYKGNGGLWVALWIREHDPLADDIFTQNATYSFCSVTGSQIMSALSSNPGDQKLAEQHGFTVNSISMGLSFKIVAVLR